MLVAYTGVPGGGKSLHAAQDILDSLTKKDVPVIANFDINRRKVNKVLFKRSLADFYYVQNQFLKPSGLIEFSNDYYSRKKFHEHGILLVIDEAQLLFNSRSWNDEARADWIYFFTNSRHFGYKVILITQFLEMIDKQIRSIIEIEVKHRNMANFGILGKFMSLFVGGKLFACIGYYVGLKERISVQYVLGRRHLYDFYDSYDVDSFALSSSAEGAIQPSRAALTSSASKAPSRP